MCQGDLLALAARRAISFRSPPSRSPWLDFELGPSPDRGSAIVVNRALGDGEILELTYVKCMYEMHATMCRALRLEFPRRARVVSRQT